MKIVVDVNRHMWDYAPQREINQLAVGDRAMNKRAQMAKMFLNLLKTDTDPGRARQVYDDWMFYATRGEVRRHWRKWMGAFPGWAKAVEIGEVS